MRGFFVGIGRLPPDVVHALMAIDEIERRRRGIEVEAAGSPLALATRTNDVCQALSAEQADGPITVTTEDEGACVYEPPAGVAASPAPRPLSRSERRRNARRSR